ncbi:MAG TPA: hypothetical protein VNA12_01695, partial [Mycobacteriales bacterium]|nr:hypothetical protein [Mycobacteriales bacterium]
MTTDVEHLLTETLQSDSARAPGPDDLLNRVHARARQRAHRRVATGGGVLAVAVMGSAAAVTLRPHGHDEIVRRPDPVAAGPETAAPGTGAPYAAGALPPLEFPLTPGWLPDGVSRTPRVTLGDSGLEASYDDATRPRFLGVSIWSADRDVSPSGAEVTRRATTVSGKPGELVTFADTLSLAWQHSPGAWRVVTGGNGWGAEGVVRRVAESLLEEPFDVRIPLDLTLMPHDSVPAGWSTDGAVTLVRRDKVEPWKAGDGDVPGVVLITARRARADLTGRGEEVTVSGHRGWLLRQ